MDYNKLVESLEKMLPPKIPYGELVGAPWPYTGQGEMVYEEPESYFIKMRRKTPAFRHGDISRALFSRHLLH